MEDTEVALRFYRDQLGLSVAGTSENHGVELGHPNGVFGARLRITGLRAPQGFGVELLEYRTPRDGRPRPPDARASDLLHSTSQIRVRSVSRIADRLGSGPGALVPPGVVSLPGGELGFVRALTASDPDGHVLRLCGEPVDRGARP